MTMDELKKAVDVKSEKLKMKPISNFDLNFLATAYLACLYEFKINNKVPVVLTNVKQLPLMGAMLRKNYEGVEPEIRQFLPASAVPTKKALDHRWVASKALNMMVPTLKPRVQELLK